MVKKMFPLFIGLMISTCSLAFGFFHESDRVPVASDRTFNKTRASVIELMRMSGYKVDTLTGKECYELEINIRNIYDSELQSVYGANNCSDTSNIGLLIVSSRNDKANIAHIGILKVLNFGKVLETTRTHLTKKKLNIKSEDGKCSAEIAFDEKINSFYSDTYKRDYIQINCELRK